MISPEILEKRVKGLTIVGCELELDHILLLYLSDESTLRIAVEDWSGDLPSDIELTAEKVFPCCEPDDDTYDKENGGA